MKREYIFGAVSKKSKMILPSYIGNFIKDWPCGSYLVMNITPIDIGDRLNIFMSKSRTQGMYYDFFLMMGVVFMIHVRPIFIISLILIIMFIFYLLFVFIYLSDI